MFDTSKDLLESVNRIRAKNELGRKARDMVLDEYGVFNEHALPGELKEEFEQRVLEVLAEAEVNELSKATLTSYKTKAKMDAKAEPPTKSGPSATEMLSHRSGKKGT